MHWCPNRKASKRAFQKELDQVRLESKQYREIFDRLEKEHDVQSRKLQRVISEQRKVTEIEGVRSRGSPTSAEAT